MCGIHINSSSAAETKDTSDPDCKMSLGLLRKPFDKLKSLSNSSASSRAASAEGRDGANREKANGAFVDESHINNMSHQQIAEERRLRSESRERKKVQSKQRESMSRKIDKPFVAEDAPQRMKLYKTLTMNMSKRREHEERFQFKDLDIESEWSLLLPSASVDSYLYSK